MDINGNLQKMVRKMDNICLVFLEKVCEAIYFSLFLIYGKNLKEKRILFIGIMIFEYLMITKLIQYNVWIHISYIIMTYINLKVLYKEKAQITDIFLFGAASIFLMIVSILCGIIIFKHLDWYFYFLILNRIIIFAFVFLMKNKLYNIYSKFFKNWNKRHNPKIKSITLRNISVIIFNLMFYFINLCMLIATAFVQGR